MQPSKTNNHLTINRFDNRELLFETIAQDIEQSLQQALAQYDSASFIIPGGTTPGPAFKSLSNADLDWSKVSIAQSDERWLDASHEQSNQKLTERALLINKASKANYIAMKNNADTAKAGLSQCNQDYLSMHTPFTVTMLGMGLDGHFASLFPNSNHIEQALDVTNKKLCIDIDATDCSVAGAYTERMSLTLSGILKSKKIILLITGKEKLDLIESKLNGKMELACPITYLINNKIDTPVEIYWAD